MIRNINVRQLDQLDIIIKVDVKAKDGYIWNSYIDPLKTSARWDFRSTSGVPLSMIGDIRTQKYGVCDGGLWKRHASSFEPGLDSVWSI